MTPEEMVELAIEVADEGLVTGELPIGAVVVAGDDVLARAHAMDRAQGRRLAHADLLAMEIADHRLGNQPRTAPIRVAVTLEPCLMCLGAAMALGVEEFCFGLDSPTDGAARVPDVWSPAVPDMPFSTFPRMVGGIHRERVREQFRRYVEQAPDSGFRRWAETLAGAA